MNKFIIPFLLFFLNSIFSQVIDVYSNLNISDVANITYKDNYLYYASYGQKKVFKINISTTNSIPELVAQFNENPNFLYFINNVLYVGVENPSKTYKININDVNPQSIYYTNISGPMTDINNNLYIGLYAVQKIVKIDLITDVQTEIVSGYKPNFFTKYNNELYFTSNLTNSIYKFNPANNAVSVVMSNLNYPAGIAIHQDIIFICESSQNSISYVNMLNNSTIDILQLSQNSWPNGSLIINDELYFVQTLAGKISKVNISYLIKTHFKTNASKFTVFPNPVQEKFTVNYELNDNLINYEIYNLQGQLIQNAFIENKYVDVSNLPKGTYFLLIDNISTTFIKN